MYNKHILTALSLVLALILVGPPAILANTTAPTSPVKLIFIHHSCGENWLTDGNGDLGIALRTNNYFVSDTNYGWGPDTIGDRTDIGYWYDWFVGGSSPTYLAALYSESGQYSVYTRLATDPGGENQIIMFKSCFFNAHLAGNPTDPPTTGTNSLRGQDYSSEHMTVANAKGIYNDLLTYFATRQDKLFIAITMPPRVTGETNTTEAANVRAFNNWLVNDWLDTYGHHNVAVFDFYNVMTSNGGDADTNDFGLETGNHHRWHNAAVQHVHPVDSDTAAYPSGDSHPSAAGNQKATGEFVPLLNYYYNVWHATPASTYRYYLPYFTEQSGYWNGVGLANCSASQSANVTVTVYDQSGQSRGATTTVIDPNGQKSIAVTSASGNLQEGWMLVTSDQPLGGLCFIGTLSYMADIGFISSTATSLLVPHVAQADIWDSYVLICNPNSTASTVTITFISPAGVAGLPQTSTIPALGSLQVPLSSLLAGSTTSGGKVTITATQGIAAFCLYTDIGHGGTTYCGIGAVNPSGL